jgi:ubiquinone/menaquinone biosynthesis C-methylase UbiE
MAKRIEDLLNEIKPQDIVSILKKKFNVEKIDRFFEVREYNYSGRALKVDAANSLLMKFQTLQSDFEETKVYSPAYQLLFLFDLNAETEFKHHLLNELLSICRIGNVTRTLIWSTTKLDEDVVQALKNHKADVLHIGASDIRRVGTISNFFPDLSRDYDYVVVLNKLADLMIRRLKKLFHLILSEIAAPVYNKLYGKTKVATKAVMEFEEEILKELVKKMQREGENQLAVDVGCGTGRHSFILANSFQMVHAFDFSLEMIKVAGDDKKVRGLTNIAFTVADFEYEEVSQESEFYGSADLVIASFGMGSFIEDTDKMLRRFYGWLKPGGNLFLSFYNENSIVLRMAPNWRDTSLSAHLDIDNNILRVELTPKIVFNIYCKPYSKTTYSEINRIFAIDCIYTYPTTMALLPNSLLETESAAKFFRYVDKTIAAGKEQALGHYVIVVAHKPNEIPTGYENVLDLLMGKQCEYEILEHNPVFSIEDVIREIGYFPGCMIKTVILKDKDTNELLSVCIPSEKKVDMSGMALLLGAGPDQIKLAPDKEITKLGFPIGGIAPFGFKPDLRIRRIVDKRIRNIPCDWLYMGIGDNKKTLKIRKDDFLRVIEDYEELELA